jgi:hypothetical protein
MTELARTQSTFAQATREVLETAIAPSIARALLDRAAATSVWGRVPDDASDFRTFVEGPLRIELERLLDPSEIAFVQERLAQVLWTATGEPRVLGALPRPTSDAHQSGSHPKVAERRPTMPAPASSPPEGVPSIPRPPRSPLPVRPAPMSGVAPRATRLAPTARAMPRAETPWPSCVLVVSRDASLSVHTSAELAGQCAMTVITSPTDLARAATRSGDRVVVVLDAIEPSIDIGTFVGLLPILPIDTRVVLVGTDARTRAHLAAQFPVTRTWIPCADGRTPGAFVLGMR